MNSENRFGGPWTEKKLSALKDYLSAYMKIFSKNTGARFFRTTYLDAFAGTPFRSAPETSEINKDSGLFDLYYDQDVQEYKKGSALIAVETDPPFDRKKVMAGNSEIEWTDVTWNPVTGCDKISQGCKNCYAERMAQRLKAMGVNRYTRGFQVSLHHDLLDLPDRWTKPRLVFVNSMSDLFHETVPLDFIKSAFETMARNPRHCFQVLTKRSSRLHQVANDLPWPSNIWMGVSVESERVLNRIRDLAQVPAMVRFLSCEPLIGPLPNLPLEHMHWVIVGGESGPKARPMEAAWVDSIFRQCRQQNVPFFFKQWGGIRKKRNGRLLHGRTYDEMPAPIPA